jgi:hypothetical protein
LKPSHGEGKDLILHHQIDQKCLWTLHRVGQEINKRLVAEPEKIAYNHH